MPQKEFSAPILLLAVCAAVTLVYGNHFHNDFHFDDSHTVTSNPYIRSLSHLPEIFTDARTFSTLPTHQVYRPLVTASLAIDYWLAGGLKPLVFHVTTFFWYLVQLAVLFLLCERLFTLAAPHPWNRYAAAFAAAWYGVHPAMAETVNYIIQRGDLYSTLGVIAALYLYASRAHTNWVRRYQVYLVPLALAELSKPPALIFPAILFTYIWLFGAEADGEPRERRLGFAWRQIAPSLLLTIAMAVLEAKMIPATFVPTTGGAFAYRITQPYIALRYFIEFFFPLWLSADSDRTAFTSLGDPQAIAGFLFVILLIGASVRLARRPETRPAAFGFIWFLLTLAPTSLFPLSEVENDHRMFFPFAGMALAITWLAALGFGRLARLPRAAVAAAAGCLLCAYGWGAHVRNQVWHTEETLWLDVTEKSPKNGRGLMNYGLTQMSQGKSLRALNYFERALVFNPNYQILEINLGVANGELNNDAEAERHFRRAIALMPKDYQPHYFYGRWLWKKARAYDAIGELKTAAELDAESLDPDYLLMEIYAAQGNWPEVSSVANRVLALVPTDASALQYLVRARAGASELSAAEAAARATPTPENYLNLSLLYHHNGRYQDCILAAQQALKLRPDYAEAWNNIAAAYEATSQWAAAVAAAREAVRLKPDFQLAKNNLAFSEAQERLTKHP